MTAPEPGASPRRPQTLDRGDLDLSQLRAHCREFHAGQRDRRFRLMPRSNADLAGWHWSVHFARYQGHIHRGPFTLVRDRLGRTVGQIARPLGWFTGQEPVTREQLRAEWRERHPAR